MVELYNTVFKQENCFGVRTEGCSNSIPTPTWIPFHSSHSPPLFFSSPIFPGFFWESVLWWPVLKTPKKMLTSSATCWFCFSWIAVNITSFIVVLFVRFLWRLDALKYFFVTIFCGKFSPLKYVNRLNLLMLYIEDWIKCLQCKANAVYTCIPFHPEFIYIYGWSFFSF